MEYFGWIGSILSVFGTILNANKKISTWIVWIVGNCFLIAHHIFNTGDLPTTLLFAVFQVANIYGWIKWHNDNKMLRRRQGF